MSKPNWTVGVCSWSLQSDVAGVAEVMRAIGVNHVHLAVGPALGDGGNEYLDAVKRQDWTISSTMIAFEQEDYSTLETIKATGGVVPDAMWETNKAVFTQAVDMTKELGIGYLSTHAGFIDHTQAEKYQVMCDRVQTLADIAAAGGIQLLMETGQEQLEDLGRFIREIDHPAVGINFDPANMILYDKGDPIEAVKLLGPWIRHVHIKDAIKTEVPGQWGREVPWGQGQVDGDAFLAALKSIGYEGTLAIEREAGDSRQTDIARAAELIRKAIG